LLINQAPKANAFNSELQQNIKNIRVDKRLAACHNIDGKTWCFEDPPIEWTPVEPDYREDLKRKQYQDSEYMVGYADDYAMENNCKEVFGQASSVRQPYERGFNFWCYVPTYDPSHTMVRRLNKQIMCETMATKNFPWIAQSRNLRGATNLGGYFDEPNSSCYTKVKSLQ
jgi:hypothetical protein